MWVYYNQVYHKQLNQMKFEMLQNMYMWHTGVAFTSNVEISVLILRKSWHPFDKKYQIFLSCKIITIKQSKWLFLEQKKKQDNAWQTWINKKNLTSPVVSGILKIRACVSVRKSNSNWRFQKQYVCFYSLQITHLKDTWYLFVKQFDSITNKI